jgi:hypothetical protein
MQNIDARLSKIEEKLFSQNKELITISLEANMSDFRVSRNGQRQTMTQEELDTFIDGLDARNCIVVRSHIPRPPKEGGETDADT